jgi:hypothetical protein
VDTLGLLRRLRFNAASEQDRARVARLARELHEATGDSVSLGYVDNGYIGEETAADAAERGIQLPVVQLPQAGRGFVLLSMRWVVERSFAAAADRRWVPLPHLRVPHAAARRGNHTARFLRHPKGK